MLWNMQSVESEITTDGPPLFLERYREAHKKLPDGQKFFDEYKILNISPQYKNIWTYKNSIFIVFALGTWKSFFWNPNSLLVECIHVVVQMQFSVWTC